MSKEAKGRNDWENHQLVGRNRQPARAAANSAALRFVAPGRPIKGATTCDVHFSTTLTVTYFRETNGK